MTGSRKRRGIADVDGITRAQLNGGVRQTQTLVESFAIDFAALLTAVSPGASEVAPARLDPKAGITRRMAVAGQLLLEREGPTAFDRLATHPSDTVRGWGAYLLAAIPGLGLAERLARIAPLAVDAHFGVREWAWLALRPHVAAQVDDAIALLTPWATDPHPYRRRFAVEISRPRGVWCTHIGALCREPERGRPLLRPLASERVRYVQDSVANWLNDAAKSRPEWVLEFCAMALDATSDHGRYIRRRALRSIGGPAEV